MIARIELMQEDLSTLGKGRSQQHQVPTPSQPPNKSYCYNRNKTQTSKNIQQWAALAREFLFSMEYEDATAITILPRRQQRTPICRDPSTGHAD